MPLSGLIFLNPLYIEQVIMKKGGNGWNVIGSKMRSSSILWKQSCLAEVGCLSLHGAHDWSRNRIILFH